MRVVVEMAFDASQSNQTRLFLPAAQLSPTLKLQMQTRDEGWYDTE